MSLTIPDFLIGEDLTSLTILAYTKAYGGALTVSGSSETLSGYIDAISVNPTPNVSHKKSVDTPYGHGTPTYTSFSLTLTEIGRKPVATPNIGTVPVGSSMLAALASAYNYALFTFTKGANAHANVWSCYATWENLRDGFTDSDVQTVSMDLYIIDTFSYGGSGQVPIAMTTP